MNEIENKINEILSNPESMSEIMNIAKSLGFNTDNTEPPKKESKEVKSPDIQGDMISAVTKIAPLLSEAKKDDDSTRLLKALKPLLSKPRQDKVDSAIKIIGLLRLMPILRESGALSSVFGSII
ncbi:MAG: hypothetical protein E7564_03970 [Ruminococcaceae bacterium]|nr:hypothetical protein [Oscillospiraceae bacterium]